MKQKNWILLIIAVIILVAVFYPKSYIIGGLGGYVGPEQTAYKEEYECLGFKNSYYPQGCSDCGNVYDCYGIPYGKKCYMEKYSGRTISKELTNCR